MSKPILILDIDGVIRNILPSILRCYNWSVPFPISEKDCNKYNLDFISDKRDFFIKHGEQIFRNSPMFPEVKEAIGILKKVCKVILVSSQYDENIDYTNDWLSSHSLSDIEVIYTWDKNEVQSDIIVDDCPKNLQFHNARFKFLFDAVYNKDEDYKRVFSLFHLIHELNKLGEI